MDKAIDIAIELGGASAPTIGIFIALLFLKKILEGIKSVNDVLERGRAGTSKAGHNFGEKAAERSDNRRAARAMDGRGVSRFTSMGKYRRGAKRDAVDANLKAERNRAAQSYVAGEVANDKGEATRFGRRLAGASIAGGADPQAVQRALAAAKFTIEKVEAEEVKAQHALLEDATPKDLMNIINNPKDNDPAKVAAAIEKIVKVGDSNQIAQAIDQHGNSGKSSVITRSLGSALAADKPEFLKGSDVGRISQGTLGATTQEVAARNVAAGVLSQEQMVAAAPDVLKYASDAAAALAATGDMSAVDKLKDTATKLKGNQQLVGKIKHNEESINKLAQYGTI